MSAGIVLASPACENAAAAAPTTSRPAPILQPEVIGPADVDAALFEDCLFDQVCRHMHTQVGPVTAAVGAEAPSFTERVPRRLHQIWFGPDHPEFAGRMQAWARYAADFNYSHKVWGSQDDELIAQLMPPRSYQVFQFYRARESWRAASDVLRLTLLSVFGGIYLDSDLQPPSDQDGVFDLDTWLPFENITFIAERHARETGSMATFLTNCLVMAPAHHPMIEHLQKTLPDNHHAWRSRFAEKPEYVTGPFFVTREMAGPFNVINMEEGYRMQLFGPYVNDQDQARLLP